MAEILQRRKTAFEFRIFDSFGVQIKNGEQSNSRHLSGVTNGGWTISGSDGQSGEDCFGVCRASQDCFQLQTIAKIYAFFSISQAEMGRLTLKLLKIEAPFVIAIDRTEWQLGAARVNVLMLSVNYKNISLPLFWTVIQEKGCSDNAERKAIVELFIAEFGADSIGCVTADREFASKEWLEFLVRRRISFRLRIKANARITDKRGKLMRASKMCRTLKSGERLELRRHRRLWNQAVFVAVCRKADGDNVPVISSERSGRILLEYGMRRQIETLFGCLKTRGFRLEETHLTHGERVSGLLSLLVLATVWALLSGELASGEKPLKIKKHGRLEKGIFRLGFETLRNCFCQITTNFRQKQRFQQLTLLLSCI